LRLFRARDLAHGEAEKGRFAMTLIEPNPRWRMRNALDDDCVMPFSFWCAVNGISERTGRRILASDSGPVVTKLSARRFGISVGNNRRWQESRERKSK
jgi:hypothetical protein